MIPRTSRCIYWFKDRGIESGRKAWRDMDGPDRGEGERDVEKPIKILIKSTNNTNN